jgi:glutamyl-tRNA reductase
LVLVLIHLHLLLVCGHGILGISISETNAVKQNGRMGCPFKATKAFINRQTAFISNAFRVPAGKSSDALKPLTAAGQALSFLTTRDVLLSVNTNHMKKARSSMSMSSAARKADMKLYASLMDAETTLSSEGNNNNNNNKGDGKKKKMSKRQGNANLEVLVLGLSHHNAKVEVREKLAIPEDDWNMAAADLTGYASISEASVLSTCNRFELYIAGTNQYECIHDAVDYLYKRAGGALDQATLRKNLFILSGEDAIWHLLRVSAGLDSLVVGEGQILAQVKRSYERGIEPESGRAGKVVSRMLNTAVTAGKRVRSETGISKGAVSISSAAAEFTAMKLPTDSDGQISSLADAKVAIIGAGKMARLLLVHLQTQGLKEVTIVNRSPGRVEELQAEFPNLKINLKLMDSMWGVIADSDVVYPSTASTTTLIDPEPLQECLKTRDSGRAGVQFVDISVPRNVHADCGDIEGVFSYNVDDLKAVVERNTAKRKREMIEAEGILREELGKFRLWQQSQGAIPTIARLQEKAETLRLAEVEKVSKKFANLSKKDLETVDRLSKGIVAKLLHGPMNHLRQQTEEESTRAAIDQIQRAFLLEQE